MEKDNKDKKDNVDDVKKKDIEDIEKVNEIIKLLEDLDSSMVKTNIVMSKPFKKATLFGLLTAAVFKTLFELIFNFISIGLVITTFDLAIYSDSMDLVNFILLFSGISLLMSYYLRRVNVNIGFQSYTLILFGLKFVAVVLSDSILAYDFKFSSADDIVIFFILFTSLKGLITYNLKLACLNVFMGRAKRRK